MLFRYINPIKLALKRHNLFPASVQEVKSTRKALHASKALRIGETMWRTWEEKEF
jgi:hypothetical protein